MKQICAIQGITKNKGKNNKVTGGRLDAKNFLVMCPQLD